MRATEFHLVTTRETPADAEIVSHQLMLRTGMIRKITSGIYTWSPLGLKVLRRVERVVREEMDRAGALEMLMPAIQPAELWQETGRWEVFGPQLLKIQDRGGREYAFGPTHEEVITDFARAEIRSYKQLPVTFYQIQTKFRDEIRPRFGVMRAREFLMKDGYSFHLSEPSLAETYQRMYQAYSRIFTRLELGFRAVHADSGAIGGSTSHEFHVLADSGEDQIAFSDGSDYAANAELAEALPRQDKRPAPARDLERVETPGARTVADLERDLNVEASQVCKTLLVEGETPGSLVALLLRGDHELNPVKAEKHPLVAAPLTMASEAAVRSVCGAGPGSIGPRELDLPIIADRSAALMSDFVCGANEDGWHWRGVNWERDLPLPEVADLRTVVAGDPSPDGKGVLSMARGIEVGHIFQLGRKYSEAMNLNVLGEEGRPVHLWMGCYGVGVSRIVAAAIEQNHDDRGIIWPAAMAPFQVALCPLNGHKSQRVREAAEAIYRQLTDAGVEVLMDDRGLRPGVMFNDMELLGIPHRLTVGDRGLDQNIVEYQARAVGEREDWPLEGAVERLLQRMASATQV